MTWFLLAVATIAVLTRLFTKRAVSRRLNADDGLAVISLVSLCSVSAQFNSDRCLISILDIGAGIAVSFQAANGLGKPKSTLSDTQLEIFSKVHSSSWLGETGRSQC